MYEVLQLIHVIAATVWVGGHLIVALAYLPEAVRRKSLDMLLDFERRYAKRVGVPSLLISGVTGLAMAYSYAGWFGQAWPIGVKIGLFALLVLNIVLARHELHRTTPHRTGNPIKFAVHVAIVTVISVLLVIMGWMLRMGLY